jgi:hypothetical protein
MHRPCFVPIGLLLLAAIFGHDLLMAGDAHAAPAAGHHAAMPAATDGPTVSESHHADNGGCSTIRAAVDPRFSHGSGLAIAVPVGIGEWAPEPVSIRPETPRILWPPGVRRALLQVYRI